MRGKWFIHAVFGSILTLAASPALSGEPSPGNDGSQYLDAVREFADNVLKYGRDTYGPKHTPLFVDGLNIHTHEPVTWIAPNGDRWVLSNLASQQTLFRTLDGLTTITGDPKYRKAAEEAIEYAFANLRSPNGLFYWGGTAAYDVRGEKACGKNSHTFKGFYPYYELMWRVNPEATEQLIESMWACHILDWSNLDMNRYGPLDRLSVSKGWNHEYKDGPVFFEGKGLSFFNTGSDLIYAAAWLRRLSGNKEPLVWAKRLTKRYVNVRDPKTGISYGMYTLPRGQKVPDSYDDVLRKLVPGTTDFPISVSPDGGIHPIIRECCAGYRMPTPGIIVHRYLLQWQNLLMVGEILGSEGEEFNQWALEELTAFGNGYREQDNVYVPMLTDGTDLEGYVVKVNGPLGPKGVVLEPRPVGPSDFWAYAMGHRVMNDTFMWEMARNISKGNEFGDIGVTPKGRPQLERDTNCPDPYALLAFLELHRATGKNEFLEMAKRIGGNILNNRFHKGFFVASKKHACSKFDAIDSLALLHLHLELVGEISAIPEACQSSPFFEENYRRKQYAIDNQLFYTFTDSSEPPMSLQEAAAVGDIDLVTSIIEKGTEVDARENSLYRTALHRAAMGGHKDVAQLLLVKGADVEAIDEWPHATPLYYGVKQGHKEVVELLIAHNADINATMAYPAGDTPLHSAIRAGHEDIVELLIAKGADVNIGNNEGVTPLHCIAMRPRPSRSWLNALFSGDSPEKKMAELLIAKGADVNAKDKDGHTPRWHAQRKGNRAIVPLLRKYEEMTRHDVAVLSVSGPRICNRSDTVSIRVTLKNRGDTGESCTVTLKDAANHTEIARQSTTMRCKHRVASEADLLFDAETDEVNFMGGRVCAEGDVNGDGYNDLIITASEWNGTRGRAYLYLGGEDMRGSPDRIFSGVSIGDHFGDQGATFGDISGDGYDDIVIGARGYHGNDGLVHVYCGGEEMDTTPDLTLMGEVDQCSWFGLKVSSGDMNGDGYEDVLVTALGYDNWRGRAYLFYGGNPMDSTADLILEGENTGDWFGKQAYSGGDVNGDGYGDIIIGAQHYGRDKDVDEDQGASAKNRHVDTRGRGYLYYGGHFMDAKADRIFTGKLGSEQASAVMLSDIDNDGYCDVLIGARDSDNFNGELHLYWGGDSLDESAPDMVFKGEEYSLVGGGTLGAGYFNDDPYRDIAVGGSAYDHRRGRGYIFLGGSRATMDTVCDVTFTGENQMDRFGTYISVGNIDNDRYDDIAVSAWSYPQDGRRGRAYLFHGPFMDSTQVSFTWDTTNASIGKHTLKVEIPPVPGEQKIEDNIKTVTIEVKEPAR